MSSRPAPVVGSPSYDALRDNADSVFNFSAAFEEQPVDLDAYFGWKTQKGGQADIVGAKGGCIGDASDSVREWCSVKSCLSWVNGER
jgi:hypothetical protein